MASTLAVINSDSDITMSSGDFTFFCLDVFFCDVASVSQQMEIWLCCVLSVSLSHCVSLPPSFSLLLYRSKSRSHDSLRSLRYLQGKQLLPVLSIAVC